MDSISNTLKGKNTFVSGGNRGIGKAICEKLATQGVNVILSSSGKNEQADKFAEELKRKYKIECHHLFADFKDTKAVEELALEALKKFPKIDILVNNAAVFKISEGND